MSSLQPSRVQLGDYIIGRRSALGLSQSELAERSGLTRSYVNSVERGKLGLPGVEQRRSLAAALRIRHVDLLVAAGELDDSELSAPVYKDFLRHPELMRRVESLDNASADALQAFLEHVGEAVVAERRAEASATSPDDV